MAAPAPAIASFAMELAPGDLCCSRWPDLGRPARYEACAVTFASLVVSFIFWGISLSFTTAHGTAALIENCLESLLDFLSTSVVLMRFGAADALVPTLRNEIIEARTSVLLSFVTIMLGLLFISFATYQLVTKRTEDQSDISLEIVLTLPSVVLYLVVGLMQLQLGWVLRVRSLKQDAMISILGAIIALGTLSASVVNLISWTDTSSLPNVFDAAIIREWNNTVADFVNASFAQALAREEQEYRFWWLDDTITIFTASLLLLFGVLSIIEEMREGRRFWRADFWCAPLPPRGEMIKDEVREETPLKK